MHVGVGNLLMGDGSVQQATSDGLQSALQASTNVTVTGLMPWYNFPSWTSKNNDNP